MDWTQTTLNSIKIMIDIIQFLAMIIAAGCGIATVYHLMFSKEKSEDGK